VIKENEINIENDEASLGDEDSNFACGKSRFDVMLKSMLARIEFNNCLAPIQ